MKVVTEVLNKRFTRHKLKEVPVTKHTPATEEDITDFFQTIRDVFESDMDQDKLRKEDIKKSAGLTGFIDKHCKATHFMFQIKKCDPESDEDCWFCDLFPPSLPPEVLSTLNFVPDPVLTDDRLHFKKFAEVYGTETTDKDRPSLGKSTQDGKNARDIANKDLLLISKIRTFILCVECEKPRVRILKIQAGEVRSHGCKESV
jgi:hypothetical protein